MDKLRNLFISIGGKKDRVVEPPIVGRDQMVEVEGQNRNWGKFMVHYYGDGSRVMTMWVFNRVSDRDVLVDVRVNAEKLVDRVRFYDDGGYHIGNSDFAGAVRMAPNAGGVPPIDFLRQQYRAYSDEHLEQMRRLWTRPSVEDLVVANEQVGEWRRIIGGLKVANEKSTLGDFVRVVGVQ